MAGEDPPDVAQGNQGYAVDGALVEAGLIRPLDDVAEAYGWEETIGEQLLGPMRWDDSGTQFRQGTIYGGSPAANNVGVFYNEAILERAGVDVPTTFAELEKALAAVKKAGELPIMMGNAEKWPALHVFGAIQGAFADPDVVNDWVSGVEGATFETDANAAAAQTLADWEDQGYFGDAYNGIGIDDAATRFGQGEGAFFIAGDWYAPAVIEGGGDGFGFMAPPVGESGEHASTGSLSFPWHISSQTDVLPAAVAFLGEMHAPENAQLLVDVNRIPVTSEDVEVEGEMAQDLIEANQTLMADDGQMDYLDWSTPTMYDTLGTGLQRLLADRVDVEEFLATVQQDWEAFQADR
jgi:raffinose/stachyose/melibiose transport system substrate-binding protein